MVKFLEFSVDWKTGELVCGNQTVLLEPKLVAVLRLLVEANGKLVSYEEIHQSVWPDVVVAPNALQRIITQLRRHLNDSAKSQRVIKTHPKRGYSLVIPPSQEDANMADQAEADNSLLGLKPWQPIFWLVFLAVVILSTLIWPDSNHHDARVKELQPLDAQSQQFANIVPLSDHSFVFLDKQGDMQQLVLHDTSSNTRQVLIDGLRLHGDIHYSARSNSLLFGRIVMQNHTKCAQLERYSLATGQASVLLPCRNKFNHSPSELNATQLLFTKTSKKGLSTLHLLDSSTGQVSALDAPNIVQFKPSASGKQFAVQIKEQLHFARIRDKRLVLSEPVFQFENSEQYPLVWLDKETLLAAHGKRLHWLNESGLISEQELQTTTEITELAWLGGKLFAKFSRENWQTRVRDFTDPVRERDIAASIFHDSFAQFRPNSHDVSLLSNRSGQAQIWLSASGKMHRLTSANKPVTSYIWQDSLSLVLVREGRLYALAFNPDFTANETAIGHELTADTLFQLVDNRLLLKAEMAGQLHLGWLDLASGRFDSLYQGDVHWAQRATADTLWLNTGSQIMQLGQGQLLPVEALADIVLQWRYFNRGGELYFQDKKQNVWRYEPGTATKTRVGTFGMGSLFMTDFSAEGNRMLSDNFITEQNELVQLKLRAN